MIDMTKGSPMSGARMNGPMMLAPLALLMVGGCVNLGAGKAPAQLYTLSATAHAPGGAQNVARPGTALVIAEPDTDRSLASARMVVQVTPTSIAYLKDAWWVERPARLLRNLMAEDLRASGTRPVELDEDSGVGGTRLTGRLLAMGYDAQTHAAVIRYDAVVADGKGGVNTRRFEVSQPGVSATGPEVAQALNVAANTLAGQVAQWVDQVSPATPVTTGPVPQTAPRP